jgi:hypothetical protein
MRLLIDVRSYGADATAMPREVAMSVLRVALAHLESGGEVIYTPLRDFNGNRIGILSFAATEKDED